MEPEKKLHQIFFFFFSSFKNNYKHEVPTQHVAPKNSLQQIMKVLCLLQHLIYTKMSSHSYLGKAESLSNFLDAFC